MKKIPSLFFYFLCGLFILTACKKYEEGPLISFRSPEHRLVNEWKFEQVQENGYDQSEHYTNASLNIREDGSLVLNDGDNHVFLGKWWLGDDDTKLMLEYSGVYNEFYGGISFTWYIGSKDTFDIVKLKEKEVWLRGSQYYADTMYYFKTYEYYSGTNEIEWKLKE